MAGCESSRRYGASATTARGSGSTLRIVIAITALAMGCGQRDTRVECTGRVTFAGQPVAEGSIGFFPVVGGGRSEGAVITGGRYTARLQPGRHRVEIRGSRPLAEKMAGPSDMPGGIREDYIPKQFNEASTLEVEIPATGPHELPFDLKAGK